MKKRSLLALLLVAAMVLSGCALVKKDDAVDAARTVVDVNGQVISKAAVNYQWTYNLQQQAYYNNLLNSMYGYNYYTTDTTDETFRSQMLTQTIDSIVTELVTEQKAKELKYDEFTEEEMTAIQADADANLQTILDEVKTQFYADTTLEGDELTAALTAKAEAYGYTADTMLESAKTTAMLKKLEDSVKNAVTVTDEEIQADYESKVDSAKTSYESNASSYGYAVNNSSTVYYAPAGYRYVKHILVALTQEDQDKISAIDTELTSANNLLTSYTTTVTDLEGTDTSAYDADALATYQTSLDEAKKNQADAQAQVDKLTADKQAATDAAYANIETKANDVYALATADGADFDALITEYGEDPGMTTHANGYAVCNGYTYFDTAFTDAAMALSKVGDVSPVTKGTNGYHIIKYVSDVTEGAVALDTVKDTVSASVLSTKQTEAYDAAVAEWTAAANVKTYPERMTE